MYRYTETLRSIYVCILCMNEKKKTDMYRLVNKFANSINSERLGLGPK